VVAIFARANVALFAGSLARSGAFVTSNPIVDAGRASARCLDFCGALILVPMMRRLGTWVRSTWLGRVIPVDDAIDFHRIVGHTLFFLCLFHAAAFVAAFAIGHAPSSLGQIVLERRGATGVALVVVFSIMWVCSLSFVRRSHRFELFAYTHWLWVAWFAFAIAHGPKFGLWVGAPLLGFLLEQALRWRRRAPASAIDSSRPLRSGVTRLAIARPPGFRFGPGDYAFLRIPAIARHEWHPFTISSAPERPELTFHVRSLGNWSAALRRRVEEAPDAPGLIAYVDGPYGSPSAHLFESKYAVLIGAGIGVTPFASVLESIVLRANEGGPSKLERVHFFWLNRDKYSFEWFSGLLADLEKMDAKSLLEIHLCMTGAHAGATALGLEIAREIMHAAGRSDIVTGLRTHTHLGPPDWEAMLGAVRDRHAGARVDVYFCGPPGLAKKLRPVCQRLGMTFREERF
jgi:NAD(P)H-flavin reductase